MHLRILAPSGTLTLTGQRALYACRRRHHLRDPARTAAGLPLGHTRHTARTPPGDRDRADAPR